mmetsp:Transcript_72318/g.234944  ORF Transcript_72318/g.234944 Transcript_72318/m.234944 type:complete len:388 (-) Transcript_72318:11-1174(-)
MPADLTQGPGRGRLQVVLRFVDQCVLQGRDALGHDYGERQRLGEGRDVAEGHDARQPVVAASLRDVVNHGSDAPGIHDQLGEVRCVAGDFADAGGGVFAHKLVDVLQAVQDPGEDLGLDHHLGQVHRVLRDLRQAGADLALELGVVVGDVLREQRHCTGVDDDLRQLRGVLADVAEGRGGDALQGELRFLETEDEQRHCSCIHDGVRELLGVPGDVAQGPSRGLLHRGVELLEAGDQGLERAGVDHGLCQLRRVLRHRAQHEGRRLLVETILLRQGVHELRQDFVLHHGLCQLVAVVGQPPECKCGGLLDRSDIVEEEGAQERHHAGVLQGIDVRRPGGQVGHRLHEGHAGLLVLLEDLQHSTAHVERAVGQRASGGESLRCKAPAL